MKLQHYTFLLTSMYLGMWDVSMKTSYFFFNIYKVPIIKFAKKKSDEGAVIIL